MSNKLSEAGSASSNRIWSSGAELQSIDKETSGVGGSDPGAFTISTSVKRSGNASFRYNPTSNNVGSFIRFSTSALTTQLWFRAYIYIASAPAANSYLFCTYETDDASSHKVCVEYETSSGKLRLYNAEDAALIGTGTTVLSTATWYRVELYMNTSTVSSTATELRIDGVTQASGTVNMSAGIARSGFGVLTSTTGDVYFDDLAINGNSSRSDNWPGEGKIVHLQVNADGDNTAWEASSGSDYTTIDEVPPVDTDYIETATNTATEDLNLASATSLGITNYDLIKLTQVGYRFLNCSDEFDLVLLKCISFSDSTNRLRIKATASGTVEESASVTGSDAGFEYNTNGVDSLAYHLTTYDLPGSSTAPWTATTLDTAQIGIVHADTNRTRVSSMWLLVEYIPNTGGRIFSSGAELQSAANSSTTNGGEIDSQSASGVPEISTSVYRSGAASYRLYNTVNTEQIAFHLAPASTDLTTDLYFRVYVRAAVYPASDRSMVTISNSSGTGKIAVVLKSNGTVYLRNLEDLVTIGTSTATISQTDWTRVEIRVNTTTIASTALELRLDGTSITSGTVDLTTGVARLVLGSGADANQDIYYDDLAVNEATGTSQNTWPGAGSIVHLRPNAAGDNSAWTNTYTNIDEITPDDSDFISETTTGDIMDVNIDASTLASNATISLVSVGARFNTASATQEDFKVRLKDSASGTVIESNTISQASTTFVLNQPAQPRRYPLTAYTRPDVSSGWTDTYLDSTQIGVRNTGGSGTIQVATMWLLVEYVSGITISGTIYSDEGSTAYNCSSDNLTVEVAINGGDTESTTCTAAGGTYSITTSVAPSAAAPVAVWINSGETPDATTVTLAADSITAISGLNMYQNRLIVRHEDSGPMTNSKLSTADNANAGIKYAVSGGNLTVESGISLYVWASKTFTPGGTVTTNVTGGDVKINTSGVLSMGGNALSIGGSYTNSGTFTSASNTTTFTSTATGKTLNGTLNGSSSFYNLTFNGSGGGWTFAAAVAVTNDFTVTNGAVTAGNFNLTVTRDFTLANTSGVSYTPGSSTVAVSRHYNDSGNKFVEGTTSTVSLNGTGTATLTGGFSTLNLGYSTFTTTLPNNNFTVATSLTFNGGTVAGGGSSGSISVTCTTNCTPVVFNSATTLNGTELLIYQTATNGVTITMAGADYGTWSINTFASNAAVLTSVWQLGGNITTTGNLRLDAATTATPTLTTTGSNYSITAALLMVQPVVAGRTGSWTINLNASNTSFTSTSSSITVGPDSTHTINMGSGTMTVYGNVQLSNTAGSIALSAGTSTLKWAHTSGTKTYTPNSQSLYNLTLDASGGTVQPAGAVDVNNDFTITAGTYDTVSGSNYALTVGRHLANSGTFTANNGTVTLDGSVEQNITGTWTSSSAFYNLTVTNASGTSASDCERTDFVPSVDFDVAATVTNNLVFTTANTRVEFNSGSTYTFANINWNGQAGGTKIYFRNSAASGTWLLNVSGTQTAVSYINVSRSDASGGSEIVASDGTNTDCNNNTNWDFGGNTAPDSPASLAQYKSDGTTVLATGDWTNETTVVLKATVSDTDNPDTLYLCYEVDLIANAFSNTEDGCGSSVNYVGTPLTASATVTGLSTTNQYHWQVRVKDAASEYSAWVSYGGNLESARDFGVDTTGCAVVIDIYDGTVEDVDADYNDGSLVSLSSNWDDFDCDVSGLLRYEVSIGKTAGATDVLNWTSVSTTPSTTQGSLVLNTNQNYFTNVRAVDNAGNTSTVTTSDGQMVLPEISMSISSNSLTFDLLTSSNNRTDTKTTTLTTSTNAYGGYVIRAYASGLLTSGAYTIPMFSAGTYAAPALWPAGACSGSTCGYGYTSSDTTIQGVNLFAGATKYAPFSTTSAGDIVADHTDAVNGTTGKVNNENHTITHKIAVDGLQPARTYQTVIYYIVSAKF